jgi:predicted metal-dependent RNase
LEKNEVEKFEEKQAHTQRRPWQEQRRPAQAEATAHVAKVTTESEDEVAKIILQSIPADSQITNVRFEGPNIALYTKNPKFALTELTYYLSSLSKSLKKRFIIRTDPSVRLQEDATRQAVVKLLPKDVQVSAVFCDDATGEVVLEVIRPEAIDPAMIV